MRCRFDTPPVWSSFAAPSTRDTSPQLTLAARPQFDALRGRADFKGILADAEAGRRRALATFREAGGEALLGI